MNIAFPFLLPACPPVCLSACLSVCLSVWDTTWPNASFLWYPVEISSSATCRQLAGLEALCIRKNTHSVSGSKCETITSRLRHWNLFQKKCNVPPIWHAPRADFVPAGVQRVEKGGGTVSKTENKLSPSTDYYRGRCLGVWNCVLRSMCGLAPLCFYLTHNQAGFTSILYLILSVHQRYCRSC